MADTDFMGMTEQELQREQNKISHSWDMNLYKDPSKVYRFKEGKTIIRILPAKPGANDPSVAEIPWHASVGVHRLGGTNHLCPAYTLDGGKPCPVCEKCNQLRKENDEEGVKELSLKKIQIVNAIVRSHTSVDKKETSKGTEGEVVVVTLPITVYKKILFQMSDKPQYLNATHPYLGFDFEVQSIPKAGWPNYDNSSFSLERTPLAGKLVVKDGKSLLGKGTKEACGEILAKRVNLTGFVEDLIPTTKELKAILQGVDTDDDDFVGDNDDDDGVEVGTEEIEGREDEVESEELEGAEAEEGEVGGETEGSGEDEIDIGSLDEEFEELISDADKGKKSKGKK